MSKGEDNFNSLVNWIASFYDTEGGLLLNSDGSPDLSRIQLNNNEGTINRTWLAQHLGIYDRSALKSERARKALKAFEAALGIESTSGSRTAPMTASRSELERVRAEKDKLATRILQISAELKATQRAIKLQNRQLEQFTEIRRIQLETGRNLPGLSVTVEGSSK